MLDDICKPDDGYPPNPEQVFAAVREHLRRARAAGFTLHDEEGGYYVVVGATPEDVITMAAPAPMTPYLGND